MLRPAPVDSTTYKDLAGPSANSMAITLASAVGPLPASPTQVVSPNAIVPNPCRSPISSSSPTYEARVIRAYAKLKSWNMNYAERLLAAVSLQMRGAALSLLCASQWNPYSRSLELGMYLTGLLISCIYSDSIGYNSLPIFSMLSAMGQSERIRVTQ